MSPLFTKTTAIILVAFMVGVMYFGSFLPLRKSQKYIEARQTQVTTLEQFNNLYDGVLGYSSPVGQDEIVANYLEIISNTINQEQKAAKPNTEIVRSLVTRAEKWALPIVNRRAGFGFSQTLFSLGSVYRSATIVLQEEVYYKKAIEMYRLGLEFSPDRQIFLYSLFDMYRFGKDNENARRVGERILEVYKDDNIKQILKDL